MQSDTAQRRDCALGPSASSTRERSPVLRLVTFSNANNQRSRGVRTSILNRGVLPYFDNSGAQITLGVLLAFARCLEIHKDDDTDIQFVQCRRMDPGQRTWLRNNLVPHVLMIRNSVNLAAAREQSCTDTSQRQRVTDNEVRVPRGVQK